MSGIGVLPVLCDDILGRTGGFGRNRLPQVFIHAKPIAARADRPGRGQLVAVSIEIAAGEKRLAAIAEYKPARILPVLRQRGIRMEVSLGVVTEEVGANQPIAAVFLVRFLAVLPKPETTSITEAIKHKDRRPLVALPHRLFV